MQKNPLLYDFPLKFLLKAQWCLKYFFPRCYSIRNFFKIVVLRMLFRENRPVLSIVLKILILFGTDPKQSEFSLTNGVRFHFARLTTMTIFFFPNSNFKNLEGVNFRGYSTRGFIFLMARYRWGNLRDLFYGYANFGHQFCAHVRVRVCVLAML